MLISVRVVTSSLPPEEYGAFSALTALQLFCSLALINPVGQHLSRNTHQWHSEHLLAGALRRFGAWLFWGSAVGFGLAPALTLFVADNLIPSPLVASPLVFGMVFVTSGNAMVIWLLNMLGERKASVVWGISSASLSLLASWLITHRAPTASGWMSGQLIGMAAGMLGALASLKGHLHGQLRWPIEKRFIDRETLLNYCAPLTCVTFFIWLQVSGYRLLAGDLWGLQALGLAAVGLGLANQIFNVVESVIMQYLYPMFYRTIAETDVCTTALSDLINSAGPIYLVVGSLVAAGSHSIATTLVSGTYRECATFVAVGAALETLRVLIGLVSNGAHAKRRAFSLILPWLVGALVSATLLYLAFKTDHTLIQGISIFCLGSGVALLLMVLKMHALIPFAVDLKRWIAAAFFIAAGAGYSMARPATPDTFLGASLELSVLAAVGVAACVALLRGNPALARLVMTPLSSSKGSS